MALRDELQLRRDFQSPAHEGLLGLYLTANLLKKRADEFLRAHGLTDVQFNLMLLLFYQAEEGGGLTQIELSRMMLVNRANVTGLIDRMERSRLVTRESVAGDRRLKLVRLTPRGRRLIAQVEGDYTREVERIMGALSWRELRDLIAGLEKIRSRLRA